VTVGVTSCWIIPAVTGRRRHGRRRRATSDSDVAARRLPRRPGRIGGTARPRPPSGIWKGLGCATYQQRIYNANQLL